MSKGIEITRLEHSAEELRVIASKSRDAEQVRRLLGLALVFEGVSRSEASSQSGMDRQTLRDWVHRYNEFGVSGLKSRHSPGRSRSLTAAQAAELLALTVKGPDPAHDRVVRWRCVDLRYEVARRFSVHVLENTIGVWVR